MMYPGYLWLQELNGCPIEILNDNRFNAYGPLGPAFDGRRDGACRPLALDVDPCDYVPQTYTTPGDTLNPAPWFETAEPGSSEFLGFMLEGVTGFDGSHWNRSVNTRALGGANFTPLKPRHREMAFTVLAHATTQRGLEYGRRWLEAQLAMACDGCGSYQAWIRTSYPSLVGLTPGSPAWNAAVPEGLYILNRVAMLQGPTWVDAPIPRIDDQLRRLVFTLGAGDPCLATCPSTVVNAVTEPTWLDTGPGCLPFNEWWCGPTDAFAPICGTIPAPGVLRRATISFLLEAPTGAPRLEVGVAMNPNSLTCAALPEPCALFVVSGIPAQGSLLIDGTRRRILFRPNNDSPWRAGDAYIIPVEGVVPAYPQFGGCTNALAYVRPYAACGISNDIKVSISYQLLEGC